MIARGCGKNQGSRDKKKKKKQARKKEIRGEPKEMFSNATYTMICTDTLRNHWQKAACKIFCCNIWNHDGKTKTLRSQLFFAVLFRYPGHCMQHPTPTVSCAHLWPGKAMITNCSPCHRRERYISHIGVYIASLLPSLVKESLVIQNYDPPQQPRCLFPEWEGDLVKV